MSAFIVDYKTIDNILSLRLNQKLLNNCCYFRSEFDNICNNNGYDIYKDLSRIGKKFLRLNIESVNYRYSENTDFDYAENYNFKDTDASIKQAIKNLSCLMYQSCEEENYKEKTTYKQLEKLKELYTSAMLYTDKEYSDAEWASSY